MKYLLLILIGLLIFPAYLKADTLCVSNPSIVVGDVIPEFAHATFTANCPDTVVSLFFFDVSHPTVAPSPTFMGSITNTFNGPGELYIPALCLYEIDLVAGWSPYNDRLATLKGGAICPVKFVIGQKVTATQDVYVRTTLSPRATVIWTSHLLDTATIVAGPYIGEDGLTWWYLTYDGGPSGWSTQGELQ